MLRLKFHKNNNKMRIELTPSESEKLIAEVVRQAKPHTFVNISHEVVVKKLSEISKNEFDELTIKAIERYLEKYKIADVVRNLIQQ